MKPDRNQWTPGLWLQEHRHCTQREAAKCIGWKVAKVRTYEQSRVFVRCPYVARRLTRAYECDPVEMLARGMAGFFKTPYTEDWMVVARAVFANAPEGKGEE